MPVTSSADRTARPDAVDFRFGGRLSLDLTWTMRYRAVRPTEMLRTPADLKRWLGAAGLPSASSPSDSDLTVVRELREAIYRAATAVSGHHRIAPSDRAIINRCAEHRPPYPTLTARGDYRISVVAGGVISAALGALAHDAVYLLGDNAGNRLRRCKGPLCSLFFYDDSRPGNRRWCTAARCGNKVNTRAYRERRNAADEE